MLKLQNVSFSYGKKKVLDRLSLNVDDSEILAIMGPSGCGKSTLLNLIAGLCRASDGHVLTDAKKISYAFQEPRLFPWMSVADNLFAVLPMRDETTEQTVMRALETVGLSDCADLYPSELSGGMKSRVSLARALVHGGDLFLLDEPFATLDEALREELATALRKEFKSRAATVILVTHNRSDALAMADRIVTLPH